MLHSDVYYPSLRPVGSEAMHLFVSSPAGGSASMHLMYLLSIAAAIHSIDLQAAYFVPDPIVIDALLAARQRGARVRVLCRGGISTPAWYAYPRAASGASCSKRAWKSTNTNPP